MRHVAAAMLLAAASTTHASPNTVDRWEHLLSEARGLPEKEKLKTVNSFVNSSISYRDDLDTWGAKDYWATPLESLTAGAGDCEDYAIAKYFSLIRLGVQQERIRLMYVEPTTQRQAHVVLAYYMPGELSPLILDNLTDAIVSAERRRDLKAAFSMGMDGTRLSLNGSGERYISNRLPENWARIIARASSDGSLGLPDAALEGKAAPASGTH